MDLSDLPNIVPGALRPLEWQALSLAGAPSYAPRILVLYGSLRAVSYSRRSAEEAARVLRVLGCDVRVFDPDGLPIYGAADETHPKVAELREAVLWSEGMMWSSPELHGAMSGLMKTQIDWIPLSDKGGIRPTQGKTLALLQVCGGSQSFNAVNQMRVLGRWMRMAVIPNQSSVAKAWQEFDDEGRMKPSAFYNRIVDVAQELARFTVMHRGRPFLTDRYSERVENAEEVHKRVTQAKS